MGFEPENTNDRGQLPDTQRKNILEEMNALNRLMQSSSGNIYEVSSAWENHQIPQSDKNIALQLKEITGRLENIDASLAAINAALAKIFLKPE